MKDFKAKITDKKNSYVSPYSSSRAKLQSPGRAKVGNGNKDSKILESVAGSKVFADLQKKYGEESRQRIRTPGKTSNKLNYMQPTVARAKKIEATVGNGKNTIYEKMGLAHLAYNSSFDNYPDRPQTAKIVKKKPSQKLGYEIPTGAVR